MPYTIEPNDKGEFCVYRKNEETGEAFGDTLGCHETKKEAVAQIGAIESEERRKAETKAKEPIAREKAKAAQEARSSKYNIGIKEGGNVTKPSEYANVADGDFGDPVNYSYPCDAAHIKPAVGYFNHAGQRGAGGYTAEEWAIIGKRIAAHAEGKVYKDGKVVDKKKAGKAEDSLDDQLRAIRDAFDAAFAQQRAVVQQPATMELWVKETYEDYIIVETGQTLYKVSYRCKDDGFEFAPRDEWVEVEQQWAEKAVKLTADTKDYFEFDGLAIPYIGPLEGDKDFDGEKFTPETNLCLDWFPNGRPFLWDHGFDKNVGLVAVGRQVKTWDSNVGRWAKVQIKKSNRYWEKIKELIEQGKVFFSSGALSRFIQTDKDGNILRWPWVELTGTTTPANPYAVTMPVAAKNYKSIGLEFTITGEPGEAQTSGLGEPPTAESDGIGGKQKTGVTQMELEEIKTMVADGVTEALRARQEAEAAIKAKAEADAAAKAEFDAKVAEAVKAELAQHLAPSKLSHDTGEKKASAIQVVSKYDRLKDEELDLLAYLMGQSKAGWSDGLRDALKARFDDRGQISFGSGDDAKTAIKAISVMDVTDTANWQPTIMRAELWRKVRLENKIVSLFVNIDMPSDTYDVPTESTDPTIYKVAEQTAGTPTLSTGITTSQAADTKLSLTSSKFGGAVWVSGELSEGNVFPILPIIRDQLGRKLADAAEYIIVNGDTATGTPNVSVSTPGATDKVLCDDGLRKYALITATAQGVSCGAFTFDDTVNIRKLLLKHAVNSSDLAWLCDLETWLGPLVKIDEFLTVDKYGPGAVVLTGEVGKVLGVPVIVSENIYKTGTDGKTISGGTTGNMLCVPRSRWIVGWRRHPRFGVNYYDHVDATRITVLARMGFGGFDESASTTCVALGYNITI